MQINSHLSRLVYDVAAHFGDREALIYKDFGGKVWKSASWNQFLAKVKQASNAMLNLGIGVQENIGVFSQNSVQYLYTDFGAWGIRAVTIPFYATSSEQQIQFIVTDAKIRFLFVGEQEQYDKARRIFSTCHSLQKIIVYDPMVHIAEGDTTAMHFDDFLKLGEGLPRQSEVETLQQSASMDDIANILYTSGTTGDSKGVILSMGQYHAAFVANGKCVPVTDKDRVLNFLPFTHIFEKGCKILCITVGARLIVNTYPQEVQQTMRETHPTCMSSVPRFWEKVYMGVQEKIESSGPLQRRLFRHALRWAASTISSVWPTASGPQWRSTWSMRRSIRPYSRWCARSWAWRMPTSSPRQAPRCRLMWRSSCIALASTWWWAKALPRVWPPYRATIWANRSPWVAWGIPSKASA